MDSREIETACSNLLDVNFAATVEDRLVFIHDGSKRSFAATLDQECSKRAIGCTVVELASEESSELPEDAKQLLLSSSVALISTARSYTHSSSVRLAASNGLRCATNSQLSESELVQSLLADYGAVCKSSTHYASLLDRATTVCIRTGYHAELKFTIGTRSGLKETGGFLSPGGINNLPSGEAACGIDDGTGDGILLVDGSFPGFGLLLSPLELHFEGGYLVDAVGVNAAPLDKMLGQHGQEARKLAELGIGTNPACKLVGKTVIDEKVAGTLHVAIGNDLGFGGTNAVSFHADAVVLGAELYLDGSLIGLPGRRA